MFKKIAGLFLAAAVMCSSAAITARHLPLTLLQKLKQVMLLSLMLRSQAGTMLRQYSVTFGRLTVQAIGRLGSQRKKNVSTILQQASLHMIFQ